MAIESNKSIAERREQIELMLRRERRVNVHALSQQFHVSLVTIRSDLANLERAGRLRRIRGGAVPVQEVRPLSFDEGCLTDEDEAVVQKAAALLHKRDTLLLGGGQLVLRLLQVAPADLELNVLTNSVDALMALDPQSAGNVLLLGGYMEQGCARCHGGAMLQQLEKYCVDKFIFEASGVTPTGRLTMANAREAENVHIMAAYAKECVALISRRNVGRMAFVELELPGKVTVIAAGE